MTFATCLKKARDQLGELDFDLENDLATLEDAFAELTAGGMSPKEAAIEAFNEVAAYAQAEHKALVEDIAAFAKPVEELPLEDRLKAGDMVRYQSAGGGTSGNETTIEGRVLELYETNATGGQKPRKMATIGWKKGPATGQQNVYVSRLTAIEAFTDQWQDPESPANLYAEELGDTPPLKDGEDLIIVACCDKKSGAPGKIPAIDRYQGAYYQMLDQVPPGNRPPILILSARYGFITEGTEIPDYDQKMTRERSVEFINDANIPAQLETALGGRELRNVLIVGGKDYRAVINQFGDDFLDAENVTEVSGGIGEQRSQIKAWLAKNSAPDLVPESVVKATRPEELVSRDESGAPVGPRRQDVPDEWIVQKDGQDNLRASPPADLKAWNDTLRSHADRFRAIEEERQAKNMEQWIASGPTLGFWSTKDGHFIGSEQAKPDLEGIGRALDVAEQQYAKKHGAGKPVAFKPLNQVEALALVYGPDKINTVEGIPPTVVTAALNHMNDAWTQVAAKGWDPREDINTRDIEAEQLKSNGMDPMRNLIYIGAELAKMRAGKTFKRERARRWAEDVIERLGITDVTVDEIVPPLPEGRIAPRDEQIGGAAKNVAQLLHAMGLHKKVLEGEDFHKRIENSPYLDLVIERHNDGQGEMLYLTHYIEEGGDQVLDTEAVFEIDEGQLRLVETAVRSLAGEHRARDNGFATTFTRNLIDQGFAQSGREIDPELAQELDRLVPRPYTPAKWRTAWRKMTAKNLVAAAKKVGSNATTKADAAAAIEQYVLEYRESQLVHPPKEVSFRFGRFTHTDSGMRYILGFNVTRPETVRGQAGLTDQGIKESLAGTIRHFQGQAWKKPKSFEGQADMQESGWVFSRWEDLANFIEFAEGRRPIEPLSAEPTGFIDKYFHFQGAEDLPPDNAVYVPGLEPGSGHQYAKGDNVVLQPGEYADAVGIPAHTEGRITEFDEDIDGLEAAYVDFGRLGEVFVPLKALKPRESNQPRRRKRTAKKGYGEKNKLVTKDQYEGLLDDLKKDLGKLNSGVDPQTMFKAVQIGIYHIEAGSREFVDWAIEMLDAAGEGIRPYLKDIYRSAYHVPGVTREGMTPLEELDSLDNALAQREAEEFENVVDVPAGNETGDRQPPGDAAAAGAAVEGEPEPAGDRGGPEIEATGTPRSDTEGDRGLLGTVPDPSSEYSGTGLFAEPEQPGAPAGDTGSTQPGEPGAGGGGGVQPGAGGREFTPSDVEPQQGKLDRAALRDAQAKANKLPVKLGDAENIAATLPHLTPAQQDDVLKQERRVEQGKTGMMFTNATGTGKTYTGLGIVNRHQRLTGSSEILIVTTNQSKVADWLKDAESMGLAATRLEDTKTAGEGINVTTYANFRQNLELHDRDFTLIVYDESHKIMEGQQSDEAAALAAHFAMGSHPDHLWQKAHFRIPLLRELEYGRRDFIRKYTADEMNRIIKEAEEETGTNVYVPQGDALKEQAKDNLNDRWRTENQKQYQDGYKQAKELELSPEFQALADTTFATFLSATPFPYHVNLHYANRYLFDYPDTSEQNGYNDPNSGRDAFLMANLGYHMKTGRLNKPEAGVNVDLLERNLHERLKAEGSISGRSADFGFDYSRQFPKVNPELGHGLDEGIYVLRGFNRDGEYLTKAKAEEQGLPYFNILPQAVDRDKRFGYIRLRQMMEAIKARELNERVRKHLALGRKVVVFHDYRKLHTGHPFRLEGLMPPSMPTDAMQIAAYEELQAEITAFNETYGDLRELPLANMKSVVDYIESEFNDQAAFLNGSQTDNAKQNALRMFEQDDSGVNILVVQRQSGKEGIDAHDITGEHQRVLIDMGLPTHPTDALQTEGRTYRFGVQSNAAFEYPVLGVGFEQFLFAQRAAERSRTAENLAMGNAARNIEVAFREGYLNASIIEPNPEQGTGGQQADRRVQEIDAFDQAITFYYARQRNRNRRDQREGQDYFATPEPVGLKMVEWANPQPGDRGLEPSAGHGAIARSFPEDTRNVFVEPSRKLGAEIALLAHGEFEGTQFEELSTDSKFDFVVMNPPYGQGGAKARDHVQKAMNHLTNGGRIVALIPEGPAADKKFDELIYGKEGEAEQLREKIKKAKKGTSLVAERQRLRQLEEFFIMGEVGMPRITFERAGTAVKTRILILDRYSNPEEVPYQRERIDIEAETVAELFDRIKETEMPERGEVTETASDRPDVTIEGDSVQIGEHGAEIVKNYHSKKEIDIWVVKMTGKRVPRETYLELRAASKDHGGYYSTYKGQGAIPGFIFEEEEQARAMLASYAEIVSDFDSVREQGVEYVVKDEGDQPDMFTTPKAKVDLTRQRVFFKTTGKLRAPSHVSVAETAAYVLDHLGQYAQENFVSLVTDKYDRPLAVIRHHVGTVDGASVDPRYVLGAITSIKNAAKVWFGHNHPSGRAELSSADTGLAKRLHQLTKKTGIESKGILAITPEGFASYWNPNSSQPQIDYMAQWNPEQGYLPGLPGRPVKIIKIPEFERVLPRAGTGDLPLIAAPQDAMKVAEEHWPGKTGVMFLNNRHAVVGWQEMPDEMMQRLRTNNRQSGAGLLYREWHESNAYSIIVVTNNLSAGHNVHRMATQINSTVLDILLREDDGMLASTNQRGTMDPGKDHWFSKQNKLGRKPAKGLPVADVEQAAGTFLEGLNNRVDVRITTVATQAERFPGIKEAVRAAYYAKTGELVLVAENIANKKQALEAMRHEILAHYGLNLFDPQTKRAILEKIASSENMPGMAKVFQEVRKDNPNLAGDALAQAEEVFASLAETPREGLAKVWDEIVGLVNKALRKLGLLKGVVTKAELHNLVASIAEGIRTGKERRTFPARSGPGRFSQERQARTALYSYLVKVIDESPQARATGQQWLGMLRKRGVKQEELAWTGVDDYLAERSNQPVTREELSGIAYAQAPEIRALYQVIQDEVDEGEIEVEIQDGDAFDVDPTREDLQSQIDYYLYDAREELVREWTAQNDYDIGPEEDGFTYAEDYEPTDEDLDDLAEERARSDYYEFPAKRAEVSMEGLYDGELIHEAEYTLHKDANDGDAGEWYANENGNYVASGEWFNLLDTLSDLVRSDTLKEAESRFDNAEAAVPWAGEDQMREAEFQNWTIEGGQEANYREILLQVNNLPETTAFETRHFSGGHWGDEDILMHVRVTDRQVDAKDTMLIEEIQSDWHQEGRKKGYEQGDNQDKLDEMMAERIKIRDEIEGIEAETMKILDRANVVIEDLYRVYDQETTGTEEGDRVYRAFEKWFAYRNQPMGILPTKALAIVEQFGEAINTSPMSALHGSLDKLIDEGAGKADKASRLQLRDREIEGAMRSMRGGLPDAPLKKTWHESAFRWAVWEAAKSGMQTVAWTTGDTQADRYNLAKQIDTLYLTPQGAGMVSIAGERDGKPVIEEDIEEDRLAEYVGDTIAKQYAKGDDIKPVKEYQVIVTLPSGATDSLGNYFTRKEAEWRIERNKNLANPFKEGGPEYRIDEIDAGYSRMAVTGEGLKIGGHGMMMFYDRMLTNYARKFAKKFGAEVRKTELRIGDRFVRGSWAKGKSVTVWAMDITDSMNETAIKDGFPMFQKTATNNYYIEQMEGGQAILVPYDAWQSITSANTSNNQVPAILKQVEWKKGSTNVDIGSGRYDRATEYMEQHGVTNLVYDPFNRTIDENIQTIDNLAGAKADTATVANVLNVIKEPEARDNVVRQAAKAIKPGGTAYFLMHEGNRSGIGGKTTRGWQENRRADTYIEEIETWFETVERKGSMLVAKGVKPDPYHNQWQAGGQPMFSKRRQAKKKVSQASKALSMMHEKLDSFGSIGTLPEREEYLKRRYETLGQISDIQDHAKQLHDALSVAGDEAPAVFEYLTTAEASPNVIKNQAARKAAVKAKKDMIATGQKLVDRGLLSEEVYEQNKGKYLPRLYLMHLLKDQDIIRMATGKMPSDMGYLKKRKDIPEEIRKLILGEIRDPAFLASRAYGQQERDMAILDWLSDIAKNRDWILQQSIMEWSWTDREGETHTRTVTPFWLANEAKRMDAQIPHMPLADQEKATEIMKGMKEAVADALSDEQLTSVPDGFKQIPNKARFGVMRGLVVRKEIHDDIIGSMNVVSGEQSIAEQILGTGGYATKFTQLWKWMKVAANPPAQVRNFVSNGVLLHLSGVPFHRVPKRVIQAIQQIIAAGQGKPKSEWKGFYVAKKYGVTESTFAAQELFRMERDLLDLDAKNADKISWVQLKLLWSKIMDVASDAYQFSEQIFKTAKIIDELEKGTDPADAALQAQKWLFDYSLVTPSMRYLRNAPVGVPFLTFYMKVAPRLLETMVTAPWRFAPYLAIPYAMSALLEQSADVDDDDVEALRLALPKWLQERGHAYFLPMKDAQGRWFAADFGYFLPWTMWSEMARQIGKGEINDAMMSTGVLGGPVPDLIAAVKSNTDPFTKREIANKYDSPAKQIADWMNYLYKLSAPTWLTEYGVAGHMYRALNNTVDRYGQPKSTVPQAALRMFGVNTYAVDPEHSRALNIKRSRFEISEMIRRRNRQARDKNLTMADRKEVVADWNERIQRRVADLRQYALESRVHPNLQ